MRHRRSFLFRFFSIASSLKRRHSGSRSRESASSSEEERQGGEHQKAVKIAIGKKKKMFYSLTLEKELELQPRFFGPRMREVLQQKLISEVRGFEADG